MEKWTGLRHFIHEQPKFGRNQKLYKLDPDFLPTQAKYENVYIYWFEFLKRSVAYKKVCDSRGEQGSASLKKLYKYFGNVHMSNFREWWRDKGAYLFAEDRPENEVKRIASKDELIDDPSILNIQIPLEFSKRDISRLVNKIIKKHHSGKRGQRKTDKDSTALFKVKGRVSYSALRKTLYVYDEVMKRKETGLTYWQIGNNPIVRKEVITQGEILKNKSVKRQNISYDKSGIKNKVGKTSNVNRGNIKTETDEKLQLVTATVNRLFKRAERLIKSAESGSFPRS